MLKHYQGTDIEFNEARQKMADIPEGATLIDNPVSAAPGYQIENVFVMAGVPSILQSMFHGFSARLTGGVQPRRITVQCAIGEGTIADIMQAISDQFAEVSVGSYPWFKPGQFGTAVVLTSTDSEQASQAAEALMTLVREQGFGADIDDNAK